MRTGALRYDYFDFLLELEAPSTPLVDGRAVIGTVRNIDDAAVLASHRRMIFIKGSDAETKAAQVKIGERLHVLGIPRVALGELAAIPLAAGEERTIQLPYELIVVGVF